MSKEISSAVNPSGSAIGGVASGLMASIGNRRRMRGMDEIGKTVVAEVEGAARVLRAAGRDPEDTTIRRLRDRYLRGME